MIDHKTQLRHQMRRLRGSISDLTRSDAAQNLVQQFTPVLSERSIVAGYWPIGSEMDPRPLMRCLAAQGHVLALPVVEKQSNPLVFYTWDPALPMVRGAYDIPHPDPSRSAVIIPDVILVPLLGFDVDGHRVGYGGGYYDRTLAKVRLETPETLAYGIAYEVQKVERIPSQPFDQILDGIVTEAAFYSVTRRKA